MESSETEKPPAKWAAWNYALNSLRRIGLYGSPEPEFERILQELTRQGCKVKHISRWHPTRQDVKRLDSAVEQMGWALNPRVKDDEGEEKFKTALFRQLKGADHWEELRQLAQVYLDHFWCNRSVSQGSNGENVNTQLLRIVKETAVTEIKRSSKLAFGALEDYFPAHTQFSIHIDESNPTPGETVIAGVLLTHDVIEAILPSIPNHLWQIDDENRTQCKLALNRLLECDKCLPIAMKIMHQGANPHLIDLIQCFLKVLFGWALPRKKNVGARVKVFIEQSGGEKAGQERTEYYRGTFSSAAWQSSERYKRWNLEIVKMVSKFHDGYIGNADLLAYTCSKPQEALGSWFRCAELPGYFSIPFEGVKLLEQVQEDDIGKAPETILDFFQTFYGTNLEKSVLPPIGDKLSSPGAKQLLLDALEERYKDKDRNLARLSRQLRATKAYVFPNGLPHNATFRLRLLNTVLELQDANHTGETVRGRRFEREYRKIRDEAFKQDCRLVAHVDCNLSVHYCDELNFSEAFQILLKLRNDSAFEKYDLLQKAVIESSLGQVSAMLREEEADMYFDEALKLLEKADLTDEQRRKEQVQTGTYRAINAMDQQMENAVELVESVLRQKLVPAAEQFATSLARPFEHYLLLRFLYFCKSNQDDAVRAYLEKYSAAGIASQSGSSHPWEFIEMYRGLLLFRGESEDDKPFRNAIRISDGRGGLISLIRAMISTVAWCCFNDQIYEACATEALADAAQEMTSPTAVQAINALRSIVMAPATNKVAEAMSVLPFNYH